MKTTRRLHCSTRMFPGAVVIDGDDEPLCGVRAKRVTYAKQTMQVDCQTCVNILRDAARLAKRGPFKKKDRIEPSVRPMCTRDGCERAATVFLHSHTFDDGLPTHWWLLCQSCLREGRLIRVFTRDRDIDREHNLWCEMKACIPVFGRERYARYLVVSKDRCLLVCETCVDDVRSRDVDRSVRTVHLEHIPGAATFDAESDQQVGTTQEGSEHDASANQGDGMESPEEIRSLLAAWNETLPATTTRPDGSGPTEPVEPLQLARLTHRLRSLEDRWRYAASEVRHREPDIAAAYLQRSKGLGVHRRALEGRPKTTGITSADFELLAQVLAGWRNGPRAVINIMTEHQLEGVLHDLSNAGTPARMDTPEPEAETTVPPTATGEQDSPDDPE